MSYNKNNVFLHLWLHKTATTFLQKNIFDNIPNEYIWNITRDKDIWNMINQIWRKDLSRSQKEGYRKLVNEKIKEQQSNKILISQELLSLHPFEYIGKNRKEILTDLKDIFQDHNIKIILWVREQIDILISMYKFYYIQNKWWTKDFDYFLNIINEIAKYNKETSIYEMLKYTKYIESIENIFWNNNIYIYSFTKFKNDKLRFIKDILNYLWIDYYPDFKENSINKWFWDFQVKLAKLLNKLSNPTTIDNNWFIPYNLTWIILRRKIFSIISKKKFNIIPETKQFLYEKFKNDNQKLKEKYNVEL